MEPLGHAHIQPNSAEPEKLRSLAPKGSKSEQRVQQYIQKTLEATSHQKEVEVGKVKSAFAEEAKLSKYREESVKKFQKVGEHYGGTKLLNLKGMTFVVPLDAEKVEQGYQEKKQEIASRISIIEDREHIQQARSWQNSSTTVADLLKDAESLKGTYAGFLREIAFQNNGEAHFGPDDMFITKSESSLRRKVNDDMKILGKTEEQCTQQAGDSLRGTVVLEKPENITGFVRAFQEKCQEKGYDVTFKNVWKEDRSTGYVGVHAKVKMVTDQGKTVLAELQLHLPQIYDGTIACVKEQSHHIYEYAREAYGPGSEETRKPQPPSFANGISKLQFLSHMLDIQRKPSQIGKVL
ncbi:hypothetical protein [Parachlamydia sp. AcF125]|uniref:hypothetical protein n=1 Tax=Parachlamydia sp. AcF125 TaxID=2795736 RepID=UPI001BC95547|nr:hypothetical protein [Parachlamydia sp. AcF125]MBS4168329.1 hypothetical protein [Parachlamydia sp. AcF125]